VAAVCHVDVGMGRGCCHDQVGTLSYTLHLTSGFASCCVFVGWLLCARACVLQSVCLYSLMALNNLIYGNPAAQELIADLNGVESVLACLGDCSHDIRKSAAFCTGNLVKNCRRNALLVSASSGVVALMNLLNDEDDDELSKKAFAALTHMEDVAVDAVMASLEACLAHLPHEMHAGVTPEASATVLAACPTPTVAPASSGSGAGVASEGGDNQLAMRTWLERCLPVLNGLVYTSSAGRRWLAASRKWRCGLAPLLRVFLVDVPVNVRVFAAFVMSNLSISREKELQDTAASLCAFEVLTAFLEQVEPTGDEAAEGSGEAVQAEYREARSMVYGLLVQLADHNTTNLCTLARQRRLLTRCLPADCVGATAVSEAVELLLSVAECGRAAAVADEVAPGAVLGLLQAVAGGSGSGGDGAPVLVARAAQCVMEMSGRPGQGVPIDFTGGHK